MLESHPDGHGGSFAASHGGPSRPGRVSKILRDERRSHAAEVAEEMEAQLAVARRLEERVARFSRVMGPVLFLLSLGGVGLAVVSAL